MLEVADRLFRREGLLECLTNIERWRSDARERCEAVRPARCDLANRFFERRLGNVGRCALAPADDDVNARDTTLREGWIEGRDMALVDGLEVEADLLADHGIVVFARHVDDQRDEAVEMVDARQDADAGTLGKVVDLFAELGEQVRCDLEKIIARVVFERVLQHAARMAARVEIEVGDDLLDLGAQQRDLVDGTGIGSGGEEADDAQFADDFAVRAKALDADIVHIGPAVHHRLHIGFGDDQEVRPLQESKDFRRGRDLVLALAENKNVRIGQDAEAAAFATLDGRILAFTGIDIFAHAEEGEIVVPQPFQEGDRLVALGLAATCGEIAQFRKRRLQKVQHRLPVIGRHLHLSEHVLKPLDELVCLFVAERREMKLDIAHLDRAFRIGIRIGEDNLTAWRYGEDRMYRHIDVAVVTGDLAHEAVIEEGLVVIDDGEDAHRDTAGADPVDRFDPDMRCLAVPAGNVGCGAH